MNMAKSTNRLRNHKDEMNRAADAIWASSQAASGGMIYNEDLISAKAYNEILSGHRIFEVDDSEN